MVRLKSANLENLDDILSNLDEIFEHYQCSERVKYEVSVSVEEIFTNIVTYAYGEGAGDVEIACETKGTEDVVLRISFCDWGIPFDPLSRPEPDFDTPFDERPIGGLGIYMVKKYMDHLEYKYEDGCNRLMIEKNLKGECHEKTV